MGELDGVSVTTQSAFEHNPRGVSRADAFAQGPPGLPKALALYTVAAVLALGVGGLLLGRVFSAVGLNPTPAPKTSSGATSSHSATPVTATPSSPPVAPSIPSGSPAPSSRAALPGVSAGDSALMDLTDVGPKPAPQLSLSAGPGRPLSLSQFSGKVVVVTFFDEPCDDICPVLASEITSADAALGPSAQRVAFITVDTDPLVAAKWPSSSRIFAGRPAPTNWTFASGTLQQLNHAWLEYGITVDVFRSSNTVTHNDLMYFIDPRGRLRYLSTPFANELSAGRYTLPAETIARWGHAIADVTTGLLP